MVTGGRYLLFGAVAGFGLAADLLTKQWAFDALGMPGGQIYWIVPGLFGFQTSLNEGALFGIGQGQVALFAALSMAAIVVIVGWLFVGGHASSRLLTLALACVSAGILGNLYDRCGLPGLHWNFPPDRVGQPVFAVRDFILLAYNGWTWPNFNLADTLLVCGAGLIFFSQFFMADPRGERTAAASAPSGAEGETTPTSPASSSAAPKAR